MKVENLKYEKFTFAVLIGVMLFSLIYISLYTLSMKKKMEDFNKDIQTVHNEMDLLLEFIPVKDSVIAFQKEQLSSQMAKLRQEVKKSKLSEEQRSKLMLKMNELRKQLIELKDLSQTYQQTQTAILQSSNELSVAGQEKDILLQSKDKEIADLKNVIRSMQSQKPEDVIVHHKLSVYYLTAVPQDKRNRASRTNYINIQFQLKGDITLIKNKYLHIEIRDPSHRIISTEKDKIRISNQFITGYKFEPFRYSFIKGKYSIRVYSADLDFQSVTFLTLI